MIILGNKGIIVGTFSAKWCFLQFCDKKLYAKLNKPTIMCDDLRKQYETFCLRQFAITIFYSETK